jgi:hypothetical protein
MERSVKLWFAVGMVTIIYLQVLSLCILPALGLGRIARPTMASVE